jgi:hypothetical protein
VFPEEDKFVDPRETGGAGAETRVYIAARPGASGFHPERPIVLGEVAVRLVK